MEEALTFGDSEKFDVIKFDPFKKVQVQGVLTNIKDIVIKDDKKIPTKFILISGVIGAVYLLSRK